MTHYTQHATPELYDRFYCLKVSHHYYWLNSYDEVLEFTNSKYYDPRMTYSTPAGRA